MTADGVEVLLVEDNPNDVRLTLHAFKKHHFGNNVFVVRDGAEALDFLFCREKYAQRSLVDLPKLILLDIKLPLVDGVEVLRQIKQDERLKLVPVVMLTSSAEEKDLQECYKLGVNSYIVKPLEFDKFTETVAQVGFYWFLLNHPPNRP